MLQTIKLKGELAEEFCEELEFDFDNTWQAIRGVEINYPGFERRILELHDRGYVYKVIVAEESEAAWDLDESQLGMPVRGGITLIPIPHGAGGNWGKIILGAALIVLGATGVGLFAVAPATLILIGGSLALSGIIGLLNPVQQSQQDKGNEASFIINGTPNTGSSGGRVPIPYGQNLFVGSIVVSAAVRSTLIGFSEEDRED